MVFNVLKWYLLFQNEKMVKLFTSQITDAHAQNLPPTATHHALWLT